MIRMISHVLDLQALVPDDVDEEAPASNYSAMSQGTCMCISVMSLLICSNAPV